MGRARNQFRRGPVPVAEPAPAARARDWDTYLLLGAGMAAFGLTLAGQFLVDDFSMFSSAYIRYWWQVWHIDLTRPLTWFTLWLNHLASGENPLTYHAVNLALHLAVVLLLRDGLERLVGKRAALIAAAIFAVHPIQTEAIAYVYARAIVLATLLCLVALGRWLRGQPWAAVAWFVAAMLAKEECAAFPVFLLLLHLSNHRDARERKPLAAMFLIALAIGLRTAWAGAVVAGSNVGPHAGLSAWAYLTAEGPVILRYLRMLVLPWAFTIEPEIDIRSGWLAWLAWAGIAALAGVALRYFTKARWGLWFVAGLALLLPSSSIFAAADLAADHRMYLPMIAFSTVLGLLLARQKTWVSAGVVVALVALAMAYSWTWRTPETVWANAVEHAPRKVRPRVQLARLVDLDRRLSLLGEARRIDPNDPSVIEEEGRALLSMRRPELALEAFKRVVTLKPGDAGALSNRGSAYLEVGNETAARADFEQALKLSPCLVAPRLNLAGIGIKVPSPAACRYTAEAEAQLKAGGAL